jgi:hypothetical protein
MTNAAASSLIYENVRISDIDAFFLGFNHTPTDLRQSKAHWLTKTKCLTAKCLTYSPYYPIGPVLAQLLVGDNHYNRLAGVLPNLTKVRLISTSCDTLDTTSSKHLSAKHWSRLSLPAKYICGGTGYAMSYCTGADRLEPSTVICHGDSRVRYERTKSSTIDQIIIHITVEALLPGQACPHNGINDYIRDFQGLINDSLYPILLMLETDRKKLVIRLVRIL